MTKTISRSRTDRGERSGTSVRAAADRTAPKRGTLKRVAAKVKRRVSSTVAGSRKTGVTTVTKSTRRSRPRVGLADMPAPGRAGPSGTRVGNASGRRQRLTGPGSRSPSREAAKLASVRDGRFTQGRPRFVV